MYLLVTFYHWQIRNASRNSREKRRLDQPLLFKCRIDGSLVEAHDISLTDLDHGHAHLAGFFSPYP